MYKNSLKLKKFRNRKTLKFNGGSRASVRSSSSNTIHDIDISIFNQLYDAFYIITDRYKLDINTRDKQLRNFFLQHTTLDNRKLLTKLIKNSSKIKNNNTNTQKKKIDDFVFFFNYYLDKQKEDFNAIYLEILKINKKKTHADIDHIIDRLQFDVLKQLLSVLKFDNEIPVQSTTQTIQRLEQIIKYINSKNNGGTGTSTSEQLNDLEYLELQKRLNALPIVPSHMPLPSVPSHIPLPSVPSHTPIHKHSQKKHTSSRQLLEAFTTTGSTSHK